MPGKNMNIKNFGNSILTSSNNLKTYRCNKLSVITINLNNANGLRKTIESVVNQRYTDFEYIIIDGGSTDKSVEVIKEYADNITLWISEPDNGIYNAMNKGLSKANGEYILFLNSGDWLVNNVLNKVFTLDFLDYNIIYGNAFIVYNNGRKTLHKDKREWTFYDFFTGTICHQASFIKKSIFDKFGFYDEGFKFVSDWLYYIKVIIFEDIAVKYIDLDIVNVDGHGVGSNIYASLEKQKALNSILPKKILYDYEVMCNQKMTIDSLSIEINRYKHRFYLIDYLITLIKKTCFNLLPKKNKKQIS